MLLDTTIRNATFERLPIMITSKNIEQILGVPKLKRSTREEQAAAVCNALRDWGLCNIVLALCCYTTASNSCLNEACILIEKKLSRDLLYLPCRHHIYELILRAFFEILIPQVTTSPSIPLFKNFQKQWYEIHINKYNSGIEDQTCGAILENVKEDILDFVKNKLKIKHSRGDYREFLELVLMFLGGDLENNITIHPPGAMHQVQWMARAIYSLKIFLFRNHYKIAEPTKKAIGEICVFIILFYAKAWFTCPLPEKNIDTFLSQISLKLFSQFKIDDGFLKKDPTSWESNTDFLNAKNIINSLTIINDTAERAVKLMEDFNASLTLDEEQKQYILLCVQEHRKTYPNCKKSTLQQQHDV